jgi:hypothetical protein
MALGAERLTAPQTQGLDVFAHIALSFLGRLYIFNIQTGLSHN